jgi:hypothetical protein
MALSFPGRIGRATGVLITGISHEPGCDDLLTAEISIGSRGEHPFGSILEMVARTISLR